MISGLLMKFMPNRTRGRCYGLRKERAVSPHLAVEARGQADECWQAVVLYSWGASERGGIQAEPRCL